MGYLWRVSETNKKKHAFGANHDMHGYCSRTLSVPRREQFSESIARGKLWASRYRCLRRNNRAYFLAKWTLLSLLSFQYFSQHARFPKYSPVFSWGIFSHVRRLGQSRAIANVYLMDCKTEQQSYPFKGTDVTNRWIPFPLQFPCRRKRILCVT